MTAPATKVHPMLATAATNARIQAVQINAVATHLAQLMHDYHGDLSGHGWEICTCHEAGAEFMLIKPARKGLGVTRGPVDKSNNGEN